jgi:hypothetical protein
MNLKGEIGVTLKSAIDFDITSFDSLFVERVNLNSNIRKKLKLNFEFGNKI